MEFNRSTWKKTCPSVFIALIILALVAAPALAAATTPIFRLKWGSSGSADGSFSSPVAIEATATQVYVADSINNRVQIFTRDGTFVSKIGPSFDGDGGIPLRLPQGVAVDSAGNIYIADTQDRVLKFNSSLVFQVKTGAIGLFSPSGMALDSTGSFLYVADTNNNRIVKLNTSDLTVAAGSPLGTGLNQPKDVAINAAGTHIFVADTGNNRLVKIPVAGGAQTPSTIALNQPYSIAIDGFDNIYVTNTNSNQLLKLTSAMGNNKSWGGSGTGNGQVQYPKGITVLGEDEVYVADTNNNRVQYFEFNQPMTNLVLSKASILEGNKANDLIGTFSTQDPNTVDTFTYSWTTITGETCDNGTYFNLSGANLTAKQVYDFEYKSSYSVCVKVQDTYQQNTLSKVFPILIEDGPDAPSVTSTKVYNIGEFTTRAANTTSPGFTLSPVINILDNDVNDDMTFSIVGGSFANAFEVVKVPGSKLTANLKVKDNGATPPAYQTLLDYETAPLLTNPANSRGGTVIVRITDSLPANQPRNIVEETFTITLSNQLDPAVINLPAGAFEVDELAPFGTVVGPAGVDCTPTPTPAACLITVTDQDTSISSLTLSFEPAKPSDYFAVQKVTHPTQSLWKVVTKATLPNHFTNPSVNFYLQASDGPYGAGNTNYTKLTLPIAITDSNNTPVLLADYNMHSDRTVGYVLELATDADINDTLTYQILGGNTGDTFGIVNGKIQVINDALIDFAYWVPKSPPYFELEVSVTDSANPPATAGPSIVRIHITEGNRPPDVEGTPTLTTPESTTVSPLGANVVGTIKFIDPDNDPEFSNLTITSPADGPFVVNKTCFAPCVADVTVNTDKLSQIDYETAPGHALSITVTFSDGVALPVTRTYPVTITNVNEPITIDNASTPISVHDRWEAGYEVGTVAWTDLDGNANTQPIFTLTGEGAEHFGINQSTGKIYILPTANLHYYQGSVYRPTILVRDLDTGGFQTSAQFTINLIDDNDPPSFKTFEYANTLTNTLKENEPDGTVVGSFVVFDENGEDFSVSIDGGNGAFSITTQAMDPVVANGKTMIHKRVTVAIADTTKIDYDTAVNQQAPIALRGVELVTTPLSRTHTYNIALENVNEPPVIADQQFFTYQYAEYAVVVGTLQSSDPDANTTRTYEIVSPGTAGALFDMNTSTGVLSVKRGISLLVIPGSYTMTVRVKDNGQPVAYSGNATITVTVTPKADPAVTAVTVPAAELLVGSPMQYNVTVTNLADGVSSTYALQVKLPQGVGFELPGSTAGCVLKTLDTVECPGTALQPMNQAGSTHTYLINAYIYSSTSPNVTLKTTASLVLGDTLNDLNTANNVHNTTVFTTRKSIVITDQNFESLDPQNLTFGGPAATRTTAPACVTSPQSFAGLYSNGTLQYTKPLISHSKVVVSFDLYLPYTWDGAGTTLGPDRWKFCQGNCQSPADFFLDTTFSNLNGQDLDGVPLNPQSYPASYSSGARYEAFTGAKRINSLGYYLGRDPNDPCTGDPMDAVYALQYEFDHTDPNLILKFIAEGLQVGIREEQWGIDNFRVVIYGEDSFQGFLPIVIR